MYTAAFRVSCGIEFCRSTCRSTADNFCRSTGQFNRSITGRIGSQKSRSVLSLPQNFNKFKKNICWCTSYGLIVLFMHVQLSGNNYLFSCFIIVNIDVKLAQCMKFGQLILRKIIKIVATRCQILRLKCTNFNFG